MGKVFGVRVRAGQRLDTLWEVRGGANGNGYAGWAGGEWLSEGQRGKWVSLNLSQDSGWLWVTKGQRTLASIPLFKIEVTLPSLNADAPVSSPRDSHCPFRASSVESLPRALPRAPRPSASGCPTNLSWELRGGRTALSPRLAQEKGDCFLNQ